MSGKGRKRSIANILDDEETPEASSSRHSSRRSTAPSRRNRSMSIIDEEDTTSTSTFTRPLVRCDCTECNGRMVDHRTKAVHESRYRGSQVTVPTAFSEPESRNQGSQVSVTAAFNVLHLQDVPETDLEEQSETDFEEQTEVNPEEQTEANLEEQYGETSISASARRTIETIEQISDDDEYSEPDFLLRRRVKKYKNRPRSDTNLPDDNDDGSSESSDSSEFTTEEDENDSQSGNESSSGEVSETFEDYSPPDYEPSQDPPSLESTIDGRFLWILL